MPDLETEKDVETLRQVALLQDGHIRDLTRKLAAAHARLEELTGENRLQQDLELVEQASAPKKKTSKRARPKKPRRRNRKKSTAAQVELPREPLRCEVDEADRVCTACGKEMKPAPALDEHSEMVTVVEVRYLVNEVSRETLVCTCGGCVETAIGPERVVDGGRYSLDFGVKVAVDKYADHLPLARQVRIMARHGLTVSTQALWDQLHHLARELELVWHAIREDILAQPVLGVDQTGWPNLAERTAKPWQMWSLTSEKRVWHAIHDDKSTATFTELLGDYRGIAVADALSSNIAGARASPRMTLACCWAHVLRRFRDAADDHPEAEWMLDKIGELYAIDDEAEDAQARGELRRTRSAAVLREMLDWLTAVRAPKTTSIGRAVRYTLRQWERLGVFVRDPAVWLDNNPTERALRGPVVGRRNHFGSKTRRGTKVAAIFYSLVETAKVCGIDPAEFIRDAITHQRAGRTILPA